MIRYLTSGESHGEALIGIVEGMPAGVELVAGDINRHLARRWLGFGRGGRSKIEQDRIQIFSGIRFSETMGSPIALKLENAAYRKDKSGWPDVMAVEGAGQDIEKITLPRPGHADLAGAQKYSFDDIRPVIDRSSARETAMRVACCSVARKMLSDLGIQIGSHVTRIGDVAVPPTTAQRAEDLIAGGAEAINDVADRSDVRMLDEDATADCVEHIKQVKREGDSLGGVYEVVITGVPVGLGSYVQWDRRLDGRLAQAVMSVQAQKAVEIGEGVAAASTRGSDVHDEIRYENGRYVRSSNRAGGIEGGVSNGMPIVVRGYMKPIPTLIKPLETAELGTGREKTTRYERSDVTSVPAASTVAEAVVAMTIANALVEKFGGDHFRDLASRVAAWRSSGR